MPKAPCFSDGEYVNYLSLISAAYNLNRVLDGGR